MSKKKYYKVVREINGRYYSVMMTRDRNGVLCREYKVGEWTYPPKTMLKAGNNLLCFQSIKAVREFDFDKNHGTPTVFECEIGSRRRGGVFGFYVDATVHSILKIFGCTDTPIGTIQTDRIMITKKIMIGSGRGLLAEWRKA